MNIVTTTSVLPFGLLTTKSLIRLKKIGFTRLDIGFSHLKNTLLEGDDWESRIKSLKRAADENGILFTHSHAVNETYFSADSNLLKCLKACLLLGIPYTVIHPIWKKADQTFYTNKDEFLTVNTAFYLPIVKAAENYGVTVLCENLLWGCSVYPEIISELVSAVDSDYFGWCFDTGHANASGLNTDRITRAGNVPLSLHIHDNHGLFDDEHLLPGDGNIDWQHFLRLLKKIGYKGDLVFEAHHQSLRAGDENERNLILSDLLSRAEKMRNYYNGL